MVQAKAMSDCNQTGSFYLDFNMAKDNPLLYGEVFAAMKFFPLRCEMLAELMKFFYVGYSPLFDDIPKGTPIPNYDILVTIAKTDPESDDYPVFESVEVKRLGSH